MNDDISGSRLLEKTLWELMPVRPKAASLAGSTVTLKL